MNDKEGCTFDSFLNTKNGHALELHLTIPSSYLDEKALFVNTNAELENWAAIDDTDSLIDIIAYTNSKPVVWSHLRKEKGQNISRYIYLEASKSYTQQELNIPVTIVFKAVNKLTIRLNIRIEMKDIAIGLGETKTGYLSHGSPLVYRFNYPETTNVRVHVTRNDVLSLRKQAEDGVECSDSQENCFYSVASIQSLDVPFSEVESSVRFHSRWQDMIGRAVIDVNVGPFSDNSFRNGFYVVIVKKDTTVNCKKENVHGMNEKEEIHQKYNCSLDMENAYKFNVEITSNEEDIIVISTVLVISCILFYLTLVLLSQLKIVHVTGEVIKKGIESHFWNHRRPHESKKLSSEADALKDSDDSSDNFYIIEEDISDDEFSIEDLDNDSIYHEGDKECSYSSLLSKIRTLLGIQSKKSIHLIAVPTEQKLIQRRKNKGGTLEDFTSKCHPSLFSDTVFLQSGLYFWNVVIIAMFYIIPTIQLVFSYQDLGHDTGNQDICYYNYLCRTKSRYVGDYGHIISNFFFICAGFFFIVFVLIRRNRRRNAMIKLYFKRKYPDQAFDSEIMTKAKKQLSGKNVEFINRCGIPEMYDLFFAMGLSLILEGIMSACYHICPSKTTFQFDTTFMFIMSALSTTKMYQFRHPDTTSNANEIFVYLGIIMTIEVLGYYLPVIVYLVIFTTFYIAFAIRHAKRFYLLEGSSKGSKTTGILGIILNFCLAAYMFIEGYKSPMGHAVSDNLLVMLGANEFLYILYYISTKCYHALALKNSSEALTLKFWVYFLLSFSCFGLAFYFYAYQENSSSLAPAESRHLNSPCILWFFDQHDVWHALSSLGIFWQFMAMMIMEDNNVSTPWNEIPVF